MRNIPIIQIKYTDSLIIWWMVKHRPPLDASTAMTLEGDKFIYYLPINCMPNLVVYLVPCKQPDKKQHSQRVWWFVCCPVRERGDIDRVNDYNNITSKYKHDSCRMNHYKWLLPFDKRRSLNSTQSITLSSCLEETSGISHLEVSFVIWHIYMM